jgi:hypothetical protein
MESGGRVESTKGIQRVRLHHLMLLLPLPPAQFAHTNGKQDPIQVSYYRLPLLLLLLLCQLSLHILLLPSSLTLAG